MGFIADAFSSPDPPPPPPAPPAPPPPPAFATNPVKRTPDFRRRPGGFDPNILTSPQGDLTGARSALKSLLGQ